MADHKFLLHIAFRFVGYQHDECYGKYLAFGH